MFVGGFCGGSTVCTTPGPYVPVNGPASEREVNTEMTTPAPRFLEVFYFDGGGGTAPPPRPCSKLLQNVFRIGG